MKYFEVDFHISSPEELMQDSRDILSALLGEAGFETFEETVDGLKGYVQQTMFSQQNLDTSLMAFPFENVTINYEIREAEDKDWNEQWEQEGFEPIVVINNKTIIVHDGRHLPTDTSLYQSPVTEIEIDAHLAFGTGTHETTQMILETLLEQRLEGCRVLDCGCGTGILGIAALKLGARESVGYDIDEWSVENARHNAVINRVDEHFISHLGDATVLDSIPEKFDFVLANINRNILLADMEAFRRKMMTGATLVLSGFYHTDVPSLVEKAQLLGFTMAYEKQKSDWACLVFRLNKA